MARPTPTAPKLSPSTTRAAGASASAAARKAGSRAEPPVRNTASSRSGVRPAAWMQRRIDEASKFVDLDQLCLSPQCGFASTEEGNVLAEDEQWAKLEMIVEIAREVWG